MKSIMGPIILSDHNFTVCIDPAVENDNIYCQYLTANRHWSLNIRGLRSWLILTCTLCGMAVQMTSSTTL